MKNEKKIETEENGERVVRLAEPVKKGPFRLLFSRFFIVALLLVIQVAVVIGASLYFRDKVSIVLVLQEVFAICMIIYLFNCKMDSTSRLSWMLIIAVVPLAGAAFFFFTQSNLGYRTGQKLVDQQIQKSRIYSEQPEGVLEELENDGSGTDDLCRYLNRSGAFPLYDHTAVTFFPLGENMFDAMLEELEKAEKFIFLEYYIIEEGYMWGRILDVLIRKANEGVDVRVMYDGMCELSKLPTNYFELLKHEGIKATHFAAIMPFVSSHYNNRDHRKILVIDNKIAFNGGINLADEYINRVHPYGHWKDTAVMIKGPAVRTFTLLFLQMWNVGAKKQDYESFIKDGAESVSDAKGYVMPFGDSPLDADKVGKSVYIDMLYRANKYVHIMTPYFIPDGELETAIHFAAERGVDVKMIVPGTSDGIMSEALAKTYYKSLLEAGVKIYEYTPGFVHAKLCVCDDIKAVVGTINYDYRSLYHNFECATYMYKTDCIADIEANFQETLTKCELVTEKTIKNQRLSIKLLGALTKFIAPLM